MQPREQAAFASGSARTATCVQPISKDVVLRPYTIFKINSQCLTDFKSKGKITKLLEENPKAKGR